MKLVYVAHPVSGNVQENLKDLLRILKLINSLREDIYAIAPYYTDALIGGENEVALLRCEFIITTGVFNECWLTGNSLTEGMSREAKRFKELNLPVKNFIGQL